MGGIFGSGDFSSRTSSLKISEVLQVEACFTLSSTSEEFSICMSIRFRRNIVQEATFFMVSDALVYICTCICAYTITAKFSRAKFFTSENFPFYGSYSYLLTWYTCNLRKCKKRTPFGSLGFFWKGRAFSLRGPVSY